jgi:hypothetical protein
MKPYKKFLVGVGAGFLMSGMALGAGDLQQEPYVITKRIVENHNDRPELSYIEITYRYKDQGKELIVCFPKNWDGKDDGLLMYAVKKGGLVREYAMRGTPCAKCHPRNKRLPIGPDDPLETG